MAIVVIFTLALGYAGGSMVAYVLIAITIVSTLSQLIRRRPLWLPDNMGAVAMTAGFCILVIAFALNGDLAHAFNFFMLLFLAPLSASLANFGSPKNSLWVAIFATVGCCIAVAIASYQVFWLQIPRAPSFGSDPIWSAQAVVFAGFLALLGLTTTKSAWRWLFAAGPLLMLIVVALSGSRGPLLAVPALALIFLIICTRRWWLSLLIACGLGLVLLGAMSWFWPEGLQRITSLAAILTDLLGGSQIAESSAGDRQLMYEAALEAFRAAPLVGYGWENRMTAIAPYLPNGLASLKAVHHHLHSDGLDFAVSAGALGLIAYALILMAPILGVIGAPTDSQRRFRLAGSIGLSVSYAIFGVTYLTFGYEYHTTLYVCLSAIIIGFCRDRAPETISSSTTAARPSHIAAGWPL